MINNSKNAVEIEKRISTIMTKLSSIYTEVDPHGAWKAELVKERVMPESMHIICTLCI